MMSERDSRILAVYQDEKASRSESSWKLSKSTRLTDDWMTEETESIDWQSGQLRAPRVELVTNT